MLNKEDLTIIYQALSQVSVQGAGARKLADLMDKVSAEIQALEKPIEEPVKVDGDV